MDKHQSLITSALLIHLSCRRSSLHTTSTIPACADSKHRSFPSTDRFLAPNLGNTQPPSVSWSFSLRPNSEPQHSTFDKKPTKLPPAFGIHCRYPKLYNSLSHSSFVPLQLLPILPNPRIFLGQRHSTLKPTSTFPN